MGKITLIIGGARSGKTTYAQKLAESLSEAVLYIATAQALDDEMAERIRRHQTQRPSHWHTLEVPAHLNQNLAGKLERIGIVLLDCTTLLVTNLLLETCPDVDHPDENRARIALQQELDELLNLIHANQPDWLIVSNEVGMGLVPAYSLGRVYRDLLGWFNQNLAAVADEVIWMVAGIPVPIGEFRNNQLKQRSSSK